MSPFKPYRGTNVCVAFTSEYDHSITQHGVAVARLTSVSSSNDSAMQGIAAKGKQAFSDACEFCYNNYAI